MIKIAFFADGHGTTRTPRNRKDDYFEAFKTKMHYFFTWERVDGANPKDNGVSCGCAGGDPFDEYVEISGGEAFDYDQLGGEKQPFSRGLVVLFLVFRAMSPPQDGR